jgi:hypothetical protein
MGHNLRVICALTIMLALLMGSFTLFEAEGEDEEEDYTDVFLYMHGVEENATINTTLDYDSKEYQVLTTQRSDSPLSIIPIGDWETKPIAYAMNIQGTVWFLLFAKGNLQQVRFTGYLTVNGVDVSTAMTTESQNLNESSETMYISTPVNITQLVELNNSDTVGLRLTLQHNDPQWYTPPPLGTGGKNVTLILGGFTPSQVSFFANSMKVTEITGWDNKQTGNMIVQATIKCSFGVEDFNYATAKSDYGTLRFRSETFEDEATIIYEWDWDYTVTEGGSYAVKVTARDKSYNSWQKTDDVHITTPSTEVDFSAGSSSISFSRDPEKNKNTTIKAKISGGGKRWSSYQVDVEFYDNSKLIDIVKATISRAKTNIVTVVWEPDSGGTHSITVVIDPEDEIPETNENNNEASKSVDVGASGGGGVPGFEAPFLITAFILVIIFNLRKKDKK